MHHLLSKDQLLWMARNQATLKFKDTPHGIRLKITCHGHKEQTVCLHNHAPDIFTVRSAMDQLITTINFFL